VALAIRAELEPDELVSITRPVRETLESCEVLIGEYREGAAGIKDCIGVLELAASQLGERGANREDRLRAAATSLEQVASTDDGDLNTLRDRLRAQVSQLVAMADEVARESMAQVQMLQSEVTTFRDRLAKAETDANTDPLTRLANRRANHQYIEELVEANATFSLILIDLNRFKQINDVYGHLIGDEVLKAFAGRLRNNLRRDDFASRWGGDEFLVVLRCGLPDAIRRIGEMESRLCGIYSLGDGERGMRMAISASFGAAERRQGESVEDLVRRADKVLYHQKVATG
jgi:diguanylate cyclase (GGDEF)-like protein